MRRVDDLQCGGMTLVQDDEGYCFTSDAVLLADFAKTRRGDLVADLGTGSGVIAVLMAAKRSSIRVVGIEIQPALLALAEENVRRNGLSGRVRTVLGDLIDAPRLLGRPADAAVSNPPYFRRDSAPLGDNEQRARARHEVDVDLAGLCAAAFRILKCGGVFSLCYPAERLAELCYELKAHRLEPKVLRAVQARSDLAPHLYLVQAVREGAPGLAHLPPLLLDGPELAAVYARTEKEEEA